MFVFTYAAGVLATMYAVTAIAFLSRRRSPLEVALASYLLTGAVWIGSNAAADVSYTASATVAFSGLAFVSIGLNLVCFLVIVDILIDGSVPHRQRILLYTIINLTPSLFSFSSYGVKDVAFPVNAPAQIVPGILYSVGLFLILVDFAYGFTKLRDVLLNEKDAARRAQITYVVIGLLITVLGLLLFDVVLPLLGEFRFYTLGPMTSLAFIIGCGYAIWHHKLIDLRLVIKMLEHKVAERTAEIRALQQQQQRIMIDLSHNLQTPLAILKSKLERLDRTIAHDSGVKSLEHSLDSLSSSINDLLSLANLDQTFRNEEARRFSLSRLLSEIVEEVSVVAEVPNIHVKSSVEENVEFFGNEKRLREAFMNLTGNAIKYMGESELKEIRIQLACKHNRALIVVADTGGGIAENDLPYIFDRFYRSRSRRYGDTPGSGLGLAITNRIVEEYGGWIEVVSEPGIGSTFTILLPLTPQ